MPQSFIFFGILHQVALASVLALPFLRLPTLATACAAMLVFALPYGLRQAQFDLPLLDEPWLLWLGLSRHVPITADYVPVFPWFGWVLTGMALARLAVPHLAESRLAAWRDKALPARVVVWGGRHSLLVYLLHQPIFIGLILLALPLFTQPSSEESRFMAACQRSCVSSSSGADACEKLCACTVDGLKREKLWQKALGNALPPEDGARVTALAQDCTNRLTARP